MLPPVRRRTPTSRQWGFVAPMSACSLAGGILGMLGAQRLPQKTLRAIILMVATSLTVAYFWKVYLR